MPLQPQIEELLINPDAYREIGDTDESLLEDEKQQTSNYFTLDETLIPVDTGNSPPPSSFTPQLPLTPNMSRNSEKYISSMFGDFVMIEDLTSLIDQNIKNLLLTIPGEYVRDINLGVGLQRFLFENNTENTILNIKTKIKSQFAKYLSYIKIQKLDVSKSDLNENRINISLQYTAGNINQEINLSVS